MRRLKVLAIGAGPVGATFALLANRFGVAVELLEARSGPSTETRSLALAHGSRTILERAGAWAACVPHAAEIHRVHTSQQGGFGRMLLERTDCDLPALGYVLGYGALQAALDAALDAAGLSVRRGVHVERIEHASCAVVELRGGERLTADAIVLADGGANLAKVAAFEVREKDYGQSALLGRIQADAAHRHTAYERFTAEGPAALLPSLAPCEYSLVWVAPPAKIAALAALPEPEFLAAFQAHFGRRAGRFVAVAGRRGFPLKLRTLNRRTSGRLAVIGNAAQALHPVAGQGFNLGLRDALHLAGELAGAREDVGAALADYALRRERDVGRTVGFTDSLIGLFDGAHLPSRVLRGIGLAALDIAPAARRLVAERLSFGAPQ